jgi:hypothetical protein
MYKHLGNTRFSRLHPIPNFLPPHRITHKPPCPISELALELNREIREYKRGSEVQLFEYQQKYQQIALVSYFLP